jgi:hypothetical protein
MFILVVYSIYILIYTRRMTIMNLCYYRFLRKSLEGVFILVAMQIASFLNLTYL